MAGRFGTFILGGLVGTIVGLLVAPRTGKETRAMVAERASSFLGDAQDWGEQAVSKGTDVVEGIANGVASRSQSVAENVQGTAENVRSVFNEKNDDLRDKIDAARERIAAQVAKNTEEDALNGEDVISAEVVDTEDIED